MWIFTTREVSVIIYSIVFLIYVLIKKGKSVFLPVIKAACHIKLIVPFIFINQRDIFQHVPITSRKPVMPDSKGVPGFFAFWGSSRILMNPGAS